MRAMEIDSGATPAPEAETGSALPARPSRRALRMKQPSRWNYWLHVLGGGGLIMATQFGNARLVLPWISQHLGVPYILVALLLPLYQFGTVAAQLLIAPHLVRMALRKRAVSGLGLVLAGVFALIFAVAAWLTPGVAAIALLGCAVLMGLSLGVLNVGRADLKAKTVARTIRGKNEAQASTLGAILTLGLTVAIWLALPRSANHHLFLLWVAVGGWLGFAWAHIAIQEQPSEPAAVSGGILEVRRGLSLFAQYPWLRRFVVWRVLLLSVELAVPFYAIHAASVHEPTASRLSAFVVALSLGLLLSGPLWGRIIDRHNALVGVLGSLLAAAAGVLVLATDVLGLAGVPFWHASLFLPLAFAREGVIEARNRLISIRAPAQIRPLMMGFNNALLACASIVVALIIGVAGHLYDIHAPLVILILVNLAAALYVPRAFAE